MGQENRNVIPRVVYMTSERPGHVLVLGTRMGESSSFWAPHLLPTDGFIHVDLDTAAFGAAFPMARTYKVQAEIGSFLEQLIEQWPIARAQDLPHSQLQAEPPWEYRARGFVRPQALMQAVQRRVIEAHDALIMAECGNSFVWASNLLRLRKPGRFRMSSGLGSMGHMTCGVVGAALARGGKAVALVGDGAMLMQHEVSTAVEHNIPAVWIVLNDSSYGMCEQGMKSFGWAPFGTSIKTADFAMMAHALGAAGVRVDREDDLEAALSQAMQSPGPYVLDVLIDKEVMAPSTLRNRSLRAQGA
jgi:acetolactate synthase-1/2/3 large subunit